MTFRKTAFIIFNFREDFFIWRFITQKKTSTVLHYYTANEKVPLKGATAQRFFSLKKPFRGTFKITFLGFYFKRNFKRIF